MKTKLQKSLTMIGYSVKVLRYLVIALVASVTLLVTGFIGVLYAVPSFQKDIALELSGAKGANPLSDILLAHIPTAPALVALFIGLVAVSYLVLLSKLLRVVEGLLAKLKVREYFVKENSEALKRISVILVIFAVMDAVINCTIPITLPLTAFFFSVLADLINEGVVLKEEHDMVI